MTERCCNGLSALLRTIFYIIRNEELVKLCTTFPLFDDERMLSCFKEENGHCVTRGLIPYPHDGR